MSHLDHRGQRGEQANVPGADHMESGTRPVLRIGDVGPVLELGSQAAAIAPGSGFAPGQSGRQKQQGIQVNEVEQGLGHQHLDRG